MTMKVWRVALGMTFLLLAALLVLASEHSTLPVAKRLTTMMGDQTVGAIVSGLVGTLIMFFAAVGAWLIAYTVGCHDTQQRINTKVQ